MKHLKTLVVIALGVFLFTPVFAETQNVKVSGSIDIYGFYRSDYDLRSGNDAGVVPAGFPVRAADSAVGSAVDRSDADEYFRSNTQLEVAADLTDNVSTVISLLNQRDWNSVGFSAPLAGALAGTTGTRNTDRAFNIDINSAYVQMKEVFFSPLTMTVGRQPIWLGRGFIIGNNSTQWDNDFTTQADEFSKATGFDALRATIDLNPWTIDLVYSKIQEASLNAEDDGDLYVAYATYRFDKYNAVTDLYYIGEYDRNTLSGAAGTRDNDTQTVGARVQLDPISQMTIGAEYAQQFGYFSASTFTPERDRDAWAADVFATYRFDHSWKPTLTVEYVAFSGEEDLTANSNQGYHAWNFLYRGMFWTAIADFREVLYATADTSDQPATQNSQFIQFKGTAKPLDDLFLELSFTDLWNDVPTHSIAGNPSSGTRSKSIGYEIDFQATYDYTEDVTLGLLAGWFIPGSQYVAPFDATAAEVVSSLKVSF